MNLTQNYSTSVLSLRGAWKRAQKKRVAARALPEDMADEAACRIDFETQSGMTIEQYKLLATQGLPGIRNANIRFDPSLRQFVLNYDGDDFSMSFGVNFKSRAMGVENVRNQSSDRGLGRRMFGLSVMTGIQSGIRILGLSAGDLMGGFTWARAGVFVEKTERSILAKKLQKRLADIQHLLSPQDYGRARNLAALKNETDLRALARLDMPVPNAGVWWDSVHQQESKNAPTHAQYVQKGFLPADGAMNLGQFLLYGMSYAGYVDLKNHAQIRTVAQSTGVPIRRMAIINRIKKVLH